MSFDLIISKGILIDGSGAKRRMADIGILGDKISAIGDLDRAEAQRIINADGKIVCPGFIDTHSHSGVVVLKEPFTAPKTMQGVTTEVIGQDGMSLAPMDKDYLVPWKKAMDGLEGDYEIDWNWTDTKGYLDRIDSMDLGPNYAFLAPHGNIRLTVMGLDDRRPTRDELKKMCDVLRQCIEQGALGMSTGLIYPPACYSDTEELVEFGRVLAEYDVPFVFHQRNEADSILESCEEVLHVARESSCKVHFSHFKVSGKHNWHMLDELLSKLDEAHSQGLQVTFDQYPYIAGSTMLAVILPPWMHDGGIESALMKLKDPKLRAAAKKDIMDGIPGWDNFVHNSGLDGIMITFVKTSENQEAIGKNLVELGELRGQEPLDAAFDLILEEENTVGLINFHGREEDIIRIMQRPEHNVCTDGIIGLKPHPRLYGTFPRVLGRYVRDKNVMSFETAINKMTGRSASLLNIRDRGLIKQGLAADVVVFDPENVIDTATYEEPIQYPKGIDFVLVNGKIIVERANPKPQKAGRVLRR